MKRPGIINTLLILAFDLVGNDGGFFQSQSVQQRIDLRSGRPVRQSFVRDRADDLMSKQAVRFYRS